MFRPIALVLFQLFMTEPSTDIKPPFYINVNAPNDKGAGKMIKCEYDYSFDSKLYSDKDSKGRALIYSAIYDYFFKNSKNKKLITLSTDPAISIATIAGINENYIKKDDSKYTSDLRILYIDADPDISTNHTDDNSNKIISTLMGLLDSGTTIPSLINHKLILHPNQIIYLGINDKQIEDNDSHTMDKLGIKYFSLHKIKKMGLKKIFAFIQQEFNNHPIHVVFDIKSLDKKLAPSTIRTDNTGIDTYLLNQICVHLKNNVDTIDIVGFDPKIDSKDGNASRVTIEVIRTIIRELFSVTENKINIFNEDTKFIIYRPVEQVCTQNIEADLSDINEMVKECGDNIDADDVGKINKLKEECVKNVYREDIGWYIMRFNDETIDQKNLLMSKLLDDNIITIPLEDEDDNNIIKEYYVSTTTMNDQNDKSYAAANSIMDLCLFPQEKAHMAFELIKNKKI